MSNNLISSLQAVFLLIQALGLVAMLNEYYVPYSNFVAIFGSVPILILNLIRNKRKL